MVVPSDFVPMGNYEGMTGAPVEQATPYSTYMYGAVSLALILAAGTMTYRFIRDKSGQTNIKKEINRRFSRFSRNNNNNEGGPDNSRFVDGGNADEESKSSAYAPKEEEKSSARDNSVINKAASFAKSAAKSVKNGASNLAGGASNLIINKGGSKSTDFDENDPAHYQQLDDQNNTPDKDQTNGQHTRVWTNKGAVMVDRDTKDKVIDSIPDKEYQGPSEYMAMDSDRPRAKVLATVVEEEEEQPVTSLIDLDDQ